MIIKFKDYIKEQGYDLSELIKLSFQNLIYENVQLKDFNKHQALSDFTKKFKDYRLKNYGKGERSALLLDAQYNFDKKNPKDNYITFFFGMNPTDVEPGYKKKSSFETDPERDFALKPSGSYIQELKFFNFWDYLDTVPGGWKNLTDSDLKKEIKNILENADIKVSCSCPSFHWQGMNWRMTQLNGSAHPTNIAPKPRTPEYPHGWANITDGGFVCKHLSILLDYSSVMFFLNQMISKIKKILKDLPEEEKEEDTNLENEG